MIQVLIILLFSILQHLILVLIIVEDNMDGQLNELIIFNRALTDTEIAEVRGYLNLKYKIY